MDNWRPDQAVISRYEKLIEAWQAIADLEGGNMQDVARRKVSRYRRELRDYIDPNSVLLNCLFVDAAREG